MRVLWFSNTPSHAVRKVSDSFNAGGSWIESLESALQAYPEVELGIAFSQLTKEIERIQVEGSRTQYYMVPRHPYSRWSRFFQRITNGPLSRKPMQHQLEVVDEFKPDLVMFFGTELDYGLIIPMLKVPSIIWFQGNLTVYERMYESGVQIRKTFWREKLRDLLLGKSILHRFLNFRRLAVREREIFAHAENFIGRTNWDRRIVSVLAPQAKYFHCEEALRQPFLESVWSPQSGRDKIVISTTIRANLYKGLECIFETSSLLTKLLNKKLEWRVIGIARDANLANITRAVTKFSELDDTVKLLGFCSGNEIVEHLLDSDLYVHPSHIENSPNGVQEAMMMGLPVVATNVGGTPSILKDGEEGLLVQNGDCYAMAGAILELLSDPDKAVRLGQNARKLGLDRNNSDNICSNLLNIYKHVVEQSSGGQTAEERRRLSKIT